MDDLPPGSRLADVRSQVTIGSESDESGFTVSTNADTTNVDTAIPDTEPFIEYDESECEMLASSLAAEKPLEEAWIYALSKAAQQEIRMHHVEPNIIPYFKSDPSQRSQVILEKLQDLLSEPQLRPETRQQFLDTINASLELNIIIFHQNPEFLASREIREARHPINAILKHFQFLAVMTKEQLQTAERVSCVLKNISKEAMLPYERLREMASVVTKYMNKPRYLEQRLISLYMDMFEEWVHFPFLRLRKPQLLDEQFPDFPRSKIARDVYSLWETIHRCTALDSDLTRATFEIKRQYFAPTMGHVCDSEEIWQQCWEQYQ